MFEVGFTEIVLIFGIALLVLGPQRLPKLAADLGRWAGRARAMARQLRDPARAGSRSYDPLQRPAAALADDPHAAAPDPTPRRPGDTARRAGQAR